MKKRQKPYVDKPFVLTIGILLLILALPITLLSLQQTQTIKQQAATSSLPTLERLEVITTQANNSEVAYGWGNHKNRIVRTSTGDIFVPYQTAGTGGRDRGWVLMHRPPSGGWTQVAQGDAGMEPINILRDPQDGIHVFAWPGESGTLQHIHSTDNGKTFLTETLPGQWTNIQGYSGSGTNDKGDMVMFKTTDAKPGQFLYTYYSPATKQWTFKSAQFDFRYTYAYFFPGDTGDLTITGMRDVLMTDLGLPCGAGFCYVLNAIGYFHTADALNPQLTPYKIVEQPPHNNTEFEVTFETDAYIDTMGRTHILYDYGYTEYEAILQNNALVKTVSLPFINSPHKARMTQDSHGRFYIITLDGTNYATNKLNVYPASSGDTDGTQFDPVVSLSLGSYPGCSGGDRCLEPSFTVPRNGHPLQDYVDGVYGNEKNVYYFRLRLTGNSSPTNPTLVFTPTPAQTMATPTWYCGGSQNCVTASPTPTSSSVPSQLPSFSLSPAVPGSELSIAPQPVPAGQQQPSMGLFKQLLALILQLIALLLGLFKFRFP